MSEKTYDVYMKTDEENKPKTYRGIIKHLKAVAVMEGDTQRYTYKGIEIIVNPDSDIRELNIKYLKELYKPKKCTICSENFIPKKQSQIYCSPKCATEGRLQKKEDREIQRQKRKEKFINSFPDLDIIDVLRGEIRQGTTINSRFIHTREVREYESPCMKYYVVVGDIPEPKDLGDDPGKRVGIFISMLPKMKIIDVWKGRMAHGSRNHKILLDASEVACVDTPRYIYKYYILVVYEPI